MKTYRWGRIFVISILTLFATAAVIGADTSSANVEQRLANLEKRLSTLEKENSQLKKTINISPGEITIKAPVKISLKAPQIEVLSSATLNLQGGGMTIIKGGLVKIN